MTTCENCRHWSSAELMLWLYPGFGVCSYTESDTNNRFQQVLLTTQDDHGYSGSGDAFMLTKPEFGCRQWEERDGQ